MPNIFHKTDLSFPIFLSETILEENGDKRNLECCIKPKPIGAPTTVRMKNPPIIKVYKDVKNPKKGKCQTMLPNVLMFYILFN